MNYPKTIHLQIEKIQRIVKHYFQSGSTTLGFDKIPYRIKEYLPDNFNSLRSFLGISRALLVENMTDYYFLNDSIDVSHALTFYSGSFNLTFKTIKKREKNALIKIFDAYSAHIRKNSNSLLSRIYGCFKITPLESESVYVLLMNNILPQSQDVNEIYDLKGSLHNRVSNTGSFIMKDQDWLNNRRKLFLKMHRKIIIDRVKIDVDFLKKNEIIDYSIMVGIKNHRCNFLPRKACQMYSDGILCYPMHETTQLSVQVNNYFLREENKFESDVNNKPETYYIGVIDFLTQWTRLKKIENFIYEALCCRRSISCVNPKDYGIRFLIMVEESILMNDVDLKSFEY